MSDKPFRPTIVTPDNAEQFLNQSALPSTGRQSDVDRDEDENKSSGKTINSTPRRGRPSSRGEGGGMNEADRLTRLETHFEYVRRDLDSLALGQSKIAESILNIDSKLATLPTKNDLGTWRLQWIAICVTAVALIVGGIIGGLDWIKADSSQIIHLDRQPGLNAPSASSPPKPG